MLLCLSRVFIIYFIVWVNLLWGKFIELLRLFFRLCDIFFNFCDRLIWFWVSVVELLRLFNWLCDFFFIFVIYWFGFEFRSLSCWDCFLGLWCIFVCFLAFVVRDWVGVLGILFLFVFFCIRFECFEVGFRSYCIYYRVY